MNKIRRSNGNLRVVYEVDCNNYFKKYIGETVEN